jgi:hypothetical protein
MNLFKLAELQLLREHREPSEALILAYAVKIRQWLDIHKQKTAEAIMQGAEVYHYGNQIKTYCRAQKGR